MRFQVSDRVSQHLTALLTISIALFGIAYHLLDFFRFGATGMTSHSSMPQVYREVAVFDNMNPGGGYSNRVQQLGTFAATNAQQGFLCEDINDPLYGNSGGAQERSALLAAVHELRLACRGLLKKLMHLQTR